MNDIIYLDPSEEITSVIDRLKSSESSGVCFVIARGSSIAQSIVNLKLLKKSATEAGKEISLISNDRITRNLASQIGLTVFSKVSEAERAVPEEPKVLEEEHSTGSQNFTVHSYYNRKNNNENVVDDDIKKEIAEVNTQESHHSDNVGEKISAKEHKSEDSHPSVEHKREDFHTKKIMPPISSHNKSSKKLITVLASVLAVVLILAFLVVVPYAAVTVQLKTENFEDIFEVAIDRNVQARDTNKMVIPGKLLELEKELTQQFDATGKKNAGEKAKGKLKVYNSLDTLSHAIPKGTKFISGGKAFVSTADITVPAATPTLISGVPGVDPGISGEVAVEADQPGDTYNIAAGDFTVSGLSSKISAKSTAAMAGGVTKEIKVVSESDLTKAETAVKDEMSKTTKTDLEELAKKDKLSIFDNEFKGEIISSSTTKKVDDETEKFDYSVKEKFFAIGFSRSELDTLIRDSAESELGSGKMLVNPDKAEITYKVVSNDLDNGVLKLSAAIKAQSGRDIREEDVKKKIRFKSVADAKQIIQDDSIVKVEIANWPKFYSRTPVLTNRVKVLFDYAD